jgi:ribosomal protein S18 acetylase RimI-like enzyme
MDVTLREGTDAALPGIVRVYVRAYAQPPWNERNDPASSERYLRWVMSQPHTFCLVAVAPATGEGGDGRNGSAVGFVLAGERPYAAFVADWERMVDRPPGGWPALPGNLGYIWEFAVDPDAQRRGIGTALLGEAITGLRTAGVERVVLRSSERATAAVTLYRRFGFERLPLAERIDPLAGPWVLALPG